MTIGPAPHEWTLLGDFAKSAVTLSSSLLALGVAFADKIPPLRRYSASWSVLQLSRVALVVATVGGVYLIALVYGIAHRETVIQDATARIEDKANPPSATEKADLEQKRKTAVEDKKQREDAVPIVGPITYIALGLFAILFAIFSAQVQAAQADATTLAQRARKAFAKDRKLTAESLSYKEIVLSPNKEMYTMKLTQPDGTAWVVDFSATAGNVIGFRPGP